MIFPKMQITVALAILIFAPGLANSTPSGGKIVVEYAEKAIDKGYGAMCSLAMTPVQSGGYYPCIDFGPYRYVRGYEAVGAFVVQKGKAPFRIMSGPPRNPEFIVAGPWMQDLPLRAVSYWNDVVEGGASRLKEAKATADRKIAAEEYINSLVKKETRAALPVPVSKEKASEPEAKGVFSDEIGKPVPDADLKAALEAVK